LDRGRIGHVLGYTIGQVGFCVAVVVMIECAILTFRAEPVAAAGAVAVLAAAFAVSCCPVTWFAGESGRLSYLVAAGAIVAAVTVALAALLWPDIMNSVTRAPVLQDGIGGFRERC
jgi:hypothetical protein